MRGPAIGLVALGVPLGSGGASSGERDVDDLRAEADARIVVIGGEGEPVWVHPGGDFNGDSIPDLLVSRGMTNSNSQGTTWVVFGARPMPGLIELTPASVDDGQGFAIEGGGPSDYAWEAAGAGDVNGDGLEDVIVGAGGADNNDRSNSGSAYVVFGKSDPAPVSLAAFDAGTQGPLGFRIDGPHEFALAGSDGVASTGDLNRDGFDDVAVRASGAGRTYVVFGRASTESIDLVELEEPGPGPELGYKIEMPTAYGDIANAGDVNGDGLDDLVLGIIGRRANDRIVRQSCACVMFGKPDASTIDIRKLSGHGFKIKGRNVYWAVAGAGDANADGRDDIVAGAPYSGHCCGRAFVIFGKAGAKNIRISDLAGSGYKIIGMETSGSVGESVSSVGDLNGDGRADQVIGAPGVGSPSSDGRDAPGAAYLVQGKKGPRKIRTSSLNGRGFTMGGSEERDASGLAVVGAADVSGDGVPDLLVGSAAGEAYLVYGR